MGIQTSLDAVQQAERLIDALRLADDLAFEASRDGGQRTIRVLQGALKGEDQVAAIAATHALAQIFDDEAEAVLVRLLSSKRTYLREHAAWALSSRLPRFDAVARLIRLVAAGEFAGMLAQRTLEKWIAATPDHIAVGLESALLGIDEPGPRARIVETVGLVRSRISGAPLMAIARDPGEADEVRVAAASAIGQRVGSGESEELLLALAAGDGPVADAARLGLVDIAAERHNTRRGAGLTVAQLFLHADIDPDLAQAGSGDNGGIATLLVRLGDALVARPADTEYPVDRVVTLSRGSVESALASLEELRLGGAGHSYGRVPLMVEPVQSASAWPLRVTARRGIRRVLRAAGPVDIIHLRMADVGSLAAVDAARELNIPAVFTVAPDPHAVIASMSLSGALNRTNFGAVDEREHFWFRTRLVQRIAANAAHTVLFPRPDLKRDMLSLVGIDISAHPERHTIVPEGIDLGVVDRAVAEATAAVETPARAQLVTLLEQLPPERRGLPLIVSVGRFHRVKGMATIVEAWAGGALKDRANLLLVGGNLAEPSADEREQLDLMDAIVPADGRAALGLLLPGHQPNDTVARWVAAVRRGIPGLAAPNGIYVCGSLKEEFGIALLEAMASGLIVVAPNGGGPATYVEQGVTGYLTSTWHVGMLAEAMTEALDAATAETSDDRAERSRRTVETSFTIQAMAGSLAAVYAYVHEQEIEHHAEPVSAP